VWAQQHGGGGRGISARGAGYAVRLLNEEAIFPSRFRFCLWHKWRKCALCQYIHYDSLAGIVRYLHADARVFAYACACACVEYFSNAAVGIPRVLYNCCIYLVKPFQINASWRGRYRRRARPFHISVKSISKSIPSECPSLIYDLSLHNNRTTLDFKKDVLLPFYGGVLE